MQKMQQIIMQEGEGGVMNGVTIVLCLWLFMTILNPPE